METRPELLSAIEAELARVPASLPKKVAALRELFQLFTRERGRLKGLSYLDIPKYRNAYLQYHLPLNVARASCALEQVCALHPEVSALTEVVDLGAGPGSASLATLFTLPARARNYALYDRSRAALAVAGRLLEGSASLGGKGPLGKVAARVGSLPALSPLPRRALVWLCMTLNELEIGSRRGLSAAGFLAQLGERLESPSVVVMVEPALRLPGRNLLALHDAAAASGSWRVLAPCTHQRSCPLLKDPGRSWCHFHFDWSAPPLVREVADPLHLSWERPSFAFLALERNEAPAGVEPRRARVIGDRMRLSGRREGFYICREGERKLLIAPSQRMERGDLIRFDEQGKARVEVPWGPFKPG
jgi:ribosomal protein RSM22 (predicted rRNA methylase)